MHVKSIWVHRLLKSILIMMPNILENVMEMINYKKDYLMINTNFGKIILFKKL